MRHGAPSSTPGTAAVNVIRPNAYVWVVVGDRGKIEQGVRNLNIGDVALLDADGNLVK